MKTRTIEELMTFNTFEERFRYLSLRANVGGSTFGHERFLNQQFYHSQEWRRTRDLVILRDEARDLGVVGREVNGRLYIHHMNPMTPDDLEEGNPDIFDIRYLIACTHETHNAIHYGDEASLPKLWTPRAPGDTKLW